MIECAFEPGLLGTLLDLVDAGLGQGLHHFQELQPGRAEVLGAAHREGNGLPADSNVASGNQGPKRPTRELQVSAGGVVGREVIPARRRPASGGKALLRSGRF